MARQKQAYWSRIDWAARDRRFIERGKKLQAKRLARYEREEALNRLVREELAKRAAARSGGSC